MLQFDEVGQCSACRSALARMPNIWFRGQAGEQKLQALAEQLKRAGHGKAYDVMLGLSGGVDSAYLAHVAVKHMGLRALAVHVDGGWNTEPAVRNIESLVRGLDLDLHTVVIEWQEMRDLQLAFLKSCVFNQDIPQDHAFFSTLYRTAAKFQLRSFLSGVNFSSEGVTISGLGYPAMDGHHVLGIHRQFGSLPLNTFPIMKLWELIWMTRLRKQLTVHRPLDYIDYDKRRAVDELREAYGWIDYGNKHCESRFTKFYQEVYLPQKFGFDKRGFHLSSLIVAGQLSRTAALEEMQHLISSPLQIRRDSRYVAKKLGISIEELKLLISSPGVDHLAYPNQSRMHALLTDAKNWLHRLGHRSRIKSSNPSGQA